jgi:AcrR family transcriptional regulator
MRSIFRADVLVLKAMVQSAVRAARLRKKPAGQYHHGELRRALIEATLGIVDREGTGAVSLSAAARRVGVSPQASYNHFRDKGALLAAAAEEAVRALTRAMRAAEADAAGPGERFEATGVAYLLFASAHPAQLRLLSAPELAEKSAYPELVAAYDEAFGVLLGAIEACQRAGVVRRSDAKKLAITAWSTVHGAAWLFVDGQLAIAGATSDPRALAGQTMRTLFKGLAPRG